MNLGSTCRKRGLFLDLGLLQVSLHTSYVHVGEIHDWTPCLNQLHCLLKVPTQSTENRERHHWSTMHPGGTVDVKFTSTLVQSLQSKIHALLEDYWWLQSKIIIDRIPQHGNSMRHCERAVIELNLHIDNVGDARSCYFRHLLGSPDSSTNRDAVSDPGHIHSSSCTECAVCHLLDARTPTSSRRASASFYDRRKNRGLRRRIFVLGLRTFCKESR